MATGGCSAVPDAVPNAVPHASALRSVAAEATEDPASDEPAGVAPLPVTRPVRNPAVTNDTLASTVCAGTSKDQPPPAYTDQVLRLELSTPVGHSATVTDPRTGRVHPVPGYRGYAGLGPADAGRVELDDLLPLVAGGDGYDPRNLWPEIGGPADVPLTGSDGKPANSQVKDQLEVWAFRQLCPPGGGPAKLTLSKAQALFTRDWYANYTRLGRPAGPTTG